MKIRTSFVTNSSSSSFILAFKDQEQLGEFKEYCEEFNYELFYDFVKDWIHKPTDEEKKEMVEKLRRYYEYEVCDKRSMLEKNVKRDNYNDYIDYRKAYDKYEQTEEFQNELEKEIQKTDFYKKKKRINKAEYVIDEMIWDTNGGAMEWMIRNGFIQNEMCKYCIYVWDVG